MSGPLLTEFKELVDDEALFKPLTVEQYHRMLEQGILAEGEPVELLGGLLIHKLRSKAGEHPMSVGHGHAFVVSTLTELSADVRAAGCHLRVQQPVTLPPHDEPEPDAAIIRGAPSAYRGRHPGPGDVTCVIEVSDSSLQRDRTTKLRTYADAGIPQYIIINLVNGVVEDHRQPTSGPGTYAPPRVLRRGEVVRFEMEEGAGIDVSVDRLLP